MRCLQCYKNFVIKGIPTAVVLYCSKDCFELAMNRIENVLNKQACDESKEKS